MRARNESLAEDVEQNVLDCYAAVAEAAVAASFESVEQLGMPGTNSSRPVSQVSRDTKIPSLSDIVAELDKREKSYVYLAGIIKSLFGYSAIIETLDRNRDIEIRKLTYDKQLEDFSEKTVKHTNRVRGRFDAESFNPLQPLVLSLVVPSHGLLYDRFAYVAAVDITGLPQVSLQLH